jgi:hypothetical protein
MLTHNEIIQNKNKTTVKYNPIKNSKWYSLPSKSYDMIDEVLVYRGINEWRIISVKIMSDIGVFYDGDKTITYCPLTKTAIGFDGKFELTNDVYHDNMILKNEDGIVVQMLGNLYGKDHTTPLIKHEIFIMQLSNTIRKYNDVLYLLADNEGKEYNTDKQVYVFDYISSDVEQGIKDILFTFDEYKTMLSYINKNESVIREKNTIIIPTTKKAWMNLNPDTTVHDL